MSAPTERIAAQLSGPLLWNRLEHLPETTSTNDEAHGSALTGTPPGLVVVADHQTAGRGRAGRDWQDLGAGQPDTDGRVPRSLLVSFLVGLPQRGVSLVPLAAGMAVADALRRQDVIARLKWPNDVLVEGGKAAGILVERHDDGGGHLVIGIGINVDWRDVDRDGQAWTSVAEHTTAEVDRWDLLADLMRALSTWLTSIPRNPTRLMLMYREDCASIGRQVRVAFPDGEQVEGVARDLDKTGRLVVETVEAGTVAVNAGDVTHL